MDMIPVSSSNLQSVGYDPINKHLDILFPLGGKYRYFDVPKSIYEGLMAASSKGSYHHEHIKNAYNHQKLS